MAALAAILVLLAARKLARRGWPAVFVLQGSALGLELLDRVEDYPSGLPSEQGEIS